MFPGNKLQEYRVGRKISRLALAEAIGIAESTVSRLELSPKANPTWDVVTKACDALGITPVDLFDGQPQPMSQTMPGMSQAMGGQPTEMETLLTMMGRMERNIKRLRRDVANMRAKMEGNDGG